jgi:hypothetical protein
MHMNNWGHYPTRHYKGAGMDVDIPLVPAPMAAATMIVGLLLGVMIGYKKAAMHRGHAAMMGGMGRGQMGGRMGYGPDGDWMMRKKQMMQAMAGHHHHGYGSKPCYCGQGMHEGGEIEEEGEE